jgi:hypothetical protein
MVWGTDSKSDESFSGEETTRTHITKRFVGGLSNPHCMKPHSLCTPFSLSLTVQPFSLHPFSPPPTPFSPAMAVRHSISPRASDCQSQSQTPFPLRSVPRQAFHRSSSLNIQNSSDVTTTALIATTLCSQLLLAYLHLHHLDLLKTTKSQKTMKLRSQR